MLKGKKILLGISGGIAAYKSILLIRLFKKAGAEVRVVATESAMWFVSRVTIESLSQNKLYDKVFGEENDYTT
ncbi:MAG: flavoprotein, partial [Bacteroidales bacterium]